MERHAGEAARLMKAMSNANRLLILCQLAEGERSVGELVATVGLSQSALSQHLAKLREDGLVATRRVSQSIVYSLSSDAVRQLIDVLLGLYCPPPPTADEDGKRPKGAAERPTRNTEENRQ